MRFLRYSNPCRSGRRPLLVDTLERRQFLSSTSISLSDTFTVPAGKTLQVPIAGDSADGQPLSYSVTGATGVTAGFRASTNTWLDLYTNKGSMRFQLFDDLAPNTTRKIRGLVEGGFYDGLTFHQLVNLNGYRYAIGGDPKGDGTGGPQFRFDDEFNKDAVFSGTGQLAMVNGEKKDNNGSQFFVTGSQARAFDFNHTIFGQIVRGGKTLDSILAAPTNSNGKPTQSITIQSARIVEDKTDAVLQLRGGTGATTQTLTVRANDSKGNVVSKTISVTVVSDAANNTPPVLLPLAKVVTAAPGERFFVPIDVLDLENDPWQIGGNILDGGEGLSYSQIDQTNKRFIFETEPGFTGPIRLKVGIKGLNAVSRGTIAIQPGEDVTSLNIFDTQIITIAVGDRPINGSAFTLASYPAIQLDNKLVAKFSSQNAGLDKSDFEASVDWGDGIVLEGAKVEALSNGTFGVYGTHTYTKTGTLPLSVTIESREGASAVVESDVHINNPFTQVGSTLYVRGTDEADDVELDVDGPILRLEIGDYEQQFDIADISSLDVQLFDGNDKLDSGTSSGMPNQRIDAGAGDDTVFAGSGNDSVIAGSGNDIVNGNGGNDTIAGGDGNDSILAGSGKNFCYGDAGNDRLTGSGGRDYFEGGADSDRLYGRGGDDYLDAGGGTDRLYGEDGNDTLIGGSSNDRMYGGAGDDLFFGRQGVDYLTGGSGTDRRGDNDASDVLTDVIL